MKGFMMTNKQVYDQMYSYIRKNEDEFERKERSRVTGREMSYAERIAQCSEATCFSDMYRAACKTWLMNFGKLKG
jgi:hypothetical protein